MGTRLAAAASAVLLLMFMAGIASAWARGLQIECGCFDGGGFAADATQQYPWEILCDVGLAATERSSKEGVTAKPTVLVNGQQLQFSSSENPKQTLRRAVNAES